MIALVKELKMIMKEKDLNIEAVSHYLDCSWRSIYRWTKQDLTPSLISRRRIREGIEKIIEKESTYDLMMKAKVLYQKIKRQVTHKEKLELFDINREKGLKAYITELERLVEKYENPRHESE